MGAGVSAYLVEGLSAERLAPILEVALARFSHDDALRRRLADVERELAERKGWSEVAPYFWPTTDLAVF